MAGREDRRMNRRKARKPREPTTEKQAVEGVISGSEREGEPNASLTHSFASGCRSHEEKESQRNQQLT